MKIKGMDENMQCRGFQFEVGKEYKKDNNGRPLELCSDTVFHYCNSLRDVDGFYDVATSDNRFFEIEVLGEEITDGVKCGSDHIKIIREIAGEELNILKGLINGNTGLFNSGYWNSGDRNSGYGNKCDGSNGVFCTKEDMNIRIFNKPSGMSLRDFYRSKYYDALCSAPFRLTHWIKYTDEEKAEDEDKALIGGYLKTYTMEEAWANWWSKLTDKNKEIIKSIPNFDAEIFKEITGIEVKKEDKDE